MKSLNSTYKNMQQHKNLSQDSNPVPESWMFHNLNQKGML